MKWISDRGRDEARAPRGEDARDAAREVAAVRRTGNRRVENFVMRNVAVEERGEVGEVTRVQLSVSEYEKSTAWDCRKQTIGRTFSRVRPRTLRVLSLIERREG